MYQYDFLVIGSGIAGLVYALEVSKLGKVAIVTKKKINEIMLKEELQRLLIIKILSIFM